MRGDLARSVMAMREARRRILSARMRGQASFDIECRRETGKPAITRRREPRHAPLKRTCNRADSRLQLLQLAAEEAIMAHGGVVLLTDVLDAGDTPEFALKQVGHHRGSPARLVFDDGAQIHLSATAVDALMAAIEDSEAGRPATLVRHAQWLSPQQAADLIGVSRPYVHTLIEKNVLSATKSGSRWLVDPDDALAYKRLRDAAPVSRERAEGFRNRAPVEPAHGSVGDADRDAARKIVEGLISDR